MLYAKAGPEPLRTMPREETDNSQASVLPSASPYNRTHPNPRHSHNSLMLEWRGGTSTVFPTIYKPQYADREKRAGSDAEVAAERVRNARRACFHATRSAARLANQYEVYRQRESPPPAAPHTAEIGAAHRRSLSPPPRRKSGRASSPLRGKKLLFSHCELSRSGRSIWRQWTETGTRLSPFPAPDRTVSPTSADAALPRQQRDLNRGAHSWKSRPQTGIFGSGAYAAASAHNRGNQLPHWMQPPRAPLPSKPRTACVCLQQWWNACRETHTAWTSVTCPRPYNYSLT